MKVEKSTVSGRRRGLLEGSRMVRSPLGILWWDYGYKLLASIFMWNTHTYTHVNYNYSFNSQEYLDAHAHCVVL